MFFKVPAMIVIGPPASGKKSLSRLLAKKTDAVLLTKASALDKAPNSLRNELKKEIEENVISISLNYLIL